MRPIAWLIIAPLALVACDPGPSPSAAVTWRDEHQRVQMMVGELASAEGTQERAARSFLEAHARELRLDVAGRTLELVTQREGLAGTYLRFSQRQRVGTAELPVFGGEVIVLVKSGGGARHLVRAVNVELRDLQGELVPGTVSSEEAVRAATGALEGEPGPAVTLLGVFAGDDGVGRVAWRVQVSTEEPAHDWELMIDATTRAVLSRRDRLQHLDGTGLVFDANPVATTGNLALRDANNATSPALDAARFSVTLPRLDGSGFTRGQWADVRTNNANSRVSSSANAFDFTRADPGFEQANAYFHLDRAQAHIQALGFTNVNNRQQVAVVDGQTADNSFYSPTNKRLSFGTGGVDDAEDGEIVLHEYGHSIQDDQVPGWGGGDEGAMGEGFGDYLAASFVDTLAPDAGHAQLSDPACVGDWDAVSYSMATPKCLRRVDSTKHYPEARANEVHDDGEMWSAALWGIRGQLGATITDRLVIEAHFLLATGSSFATAAQALITADLNVYAGAHADLIRRRMIKQGLSRIITPAARLSPATSVAVSLDNPRDSSGNYVANLDDTKTFTATGATGLLVHFSRIDTQTGANCYQGGCDNIYLTNADGDLFQVLNGAQMNVTSAAVAGDTVNIRLVTNGSQNRFGYHVDRIDVMYGNGDGGVVVIDAGAPDAGDVDAGAPDAGEVDAGVPDAGGVDAGVAVTDAGASIDAGGIDGGRLDGGAADAGLLRDAGVADAGPVDAGTGTATLPHLAADLGKLERSGCGCTSASGLEAWLGLVLAGLAAGRRKRKPARAQLAELS